MITIYGKVGCKACDDAKKLCEDNGVNFTYLTLGSDYSVSDFYGIAPKSWRSFPMVSFNGEFKGGLKELKDYIKGLI